MKQSQFDETYLQAALNAAATRSFKYATRHGLSASEREDMRQELVLDMLERVKQFDPGKGSPGTFTGVVSEHRAVEVLDRLMKDRTRLRHFDGEDAANDSNAHDWFDKVADNSDPSFHIDHDLFSNSIALCDLERALAYMNDEQIALFELLAEHQDLPGACRACGTSSATFYRRVHELQMHLRMFGFRTAA